MPVDEAFCRLLLRMPRMSFRLARNAPGLLVNSIMPSSSLSFSSRLMRLTRIQTRRCLKSSVRRTDTRECEKRFGTSHELLNRYLHISLATPESELVPSAGEQVREQVGEPARTEAIRQFAEKPSKFVQKLLRTMKGEMTVLEMKAALKLGGWRNSAGTDHGRRLRSLTFSLGCC